MDTPITHRAEIAENVLKKQHEPEKHRLIIAVGQYKYSISKDAEPTGLKTATQTEVNLVE